MIKILSTILSFDGISPDYSGIPDYARQALQNAFDNGDYVIIPDDLIAELPPPKWTPFNFQLFSDPVFVAYGLVANSVNPYLLPALVERYGLVAKDGLFESDFPSYWQAFCAALSVTSEHRNQWADLAVSFNIPADFVETIRGIQMLE